MNKGFIGEALRIPIRLEDADGNDITGAAASNIDVNFAYEDDTAFTLLTPTTDYILDELSKGQYWLEINAAKITKTGNVQVVVEDDGYCSAIEIRRYSAHVAAKKFSDGAVHVDKTNGIAGTSYPVGIRTRPANTLQNGLDIADTNKLGHVKVLLTGNETVADSGNRLRYKTIEGIMSPFRKSTIGILSFSGGPANLQGSLFKKMRIGAFSGEGQGVEFEDCYIGSGFLSDDYSMRRCVMEGALNTSGFADLLHCVFLDSDIEVQSTTAGDGFNLKGCFGKIVIKNMDNANNFINIDGFFGEIEIQSSCTLGTITIRGGGGKLTNNTGGTTVNEDGFNTNGAGLTSQEVRDAMKLAPTGGAPAAGSVDEHLDDILADTNETQGKLPTNNIMGSSVKTDKDDEIDAIKAKTDNLPADPASESSLASTHGSGSWETSEVTIRANSRLKEIFYDDYGNPTHYLEYIYANATDAEADQNPTKILDVTSTYAQDAENENRWQLTGRLIKDVTP